MSANAVIAVLAFSCAVFAAVFALAASSTDNAVSRHAGALRSFGHQLVDARANITIYHQM